MYKYSNGTNLVTGGEKHKVYVKKSPTGVGKGVKGHIMVNHPTMDKGKWDTIDLTEKSGAKTVAEGKASTKKWHAENPMQMLSGAKAVKEYRGDENLPEAKNGMKKGCGCTKMKKYKYGTGALAIPEGSAIVTANGGKNRQALSAYKKGNYKLLNKIIDDMPEDRPNGKNQIGNEGVIGNIAANATKATPGFYEKTIQGKPYNPKMKRRTDADQVAMEQEFKEEYAKNPNAPEFAKKYGKFAHGLQSERMGAVGRKEDEYTYSKDKKRYKSGYKVEGKPQVIPSRQSVKSETVVDKLPEVNVEKDAETKTQTDTKLKKQSTIPSLAEVAARASILSQGVEGVPENYLKLGRYNYASQLDRILRENAVAANAAKENIRDVVGGSAGSYLANVGAITGKRFDANAAAVTEDTLERQKILNLNVDKGDREAEVNTGLKNQFAAQRAANRGAYNNQLVALGQGIDTAVDASRTMQGERGKDQQLMQILKDNPGMYEYVAGPDGTQKLVFKGGTKPTSSSTSTTTSKPAVDATTANTYGVLAPQKKGSKRLKTYKRK